MENHKTLQQSDSLVTFQEMDASQWSRIKELVYMSFIYLAAFITPIIAPLVLMWLFLFAHFGTGIWRSKKLGVPLEHNRFFDIIQRGILFMIAILCVHAMESVFPELQGARLTRVTAMFICSLELRGILQNVRATTGVDILGQIGEYLKGFSRFASKKKDPPAQ